MLGMLRLVNPPGTPRRRPFPSYATTVSKNPTAAAKKIRAAMLKKARAAALKASNASYARRLKARIAEEDLDSEYYRRHYRNPPKRRSKKALKVAFIEIPSTPRKIKTAKTAVKNPSASTAAKRGGMTMAKLRGAKKAAFLRRMAAGRKKAAKSNPPKAKKTSKRRKLYGAAAAAHAKKAGKAPKKARRKTRKASAKHFYIRTAKGKAVKGGKRKTRKQRVKQVIYVRSPKTGRKRPYGVKFHAVNRTSVSKKTGEKKTRRVHVPKLHRAYRRNPDFKAMLIQGGLLFAGIKGMQVINAALKNFVTDKFKLSEPGADGKPKGETTLKLIGLLPSAIGFGAAAFADKVIKGQPKLVEGLQVGATIALFEGIFNAFVKPSLIKDAKAGSLMLTAFGGVGEYLPLQGYGGGYGEYLNRQQPSLGAHATEAMALDEYVSGFGGNGFDVEEALSDSEASGLQSGYAGGSLARTVFSS